MFAVGLLWGAAGFGLASGFDGHTSEVCFVLFCSWYSVICLISSGVWGFCCLRILDVVWLIL